MALSVIVTSYESPDTLRLCLQSLTAQPQACEIVVSDCSRRHPARLLQSEFPQVEFLQFEEVRTVPQLRWAALPLSTGDIVAAVEARCVPSPSWCAELIEAHQSDPASPAVGGPVAIGKPASAFDWALYVCEYGAFAPPLQKQSADAISGANLSYKRAALDAAADLLQRGAWESLLHERWLRQGLHLTQCAASVTFVNSMSIATAFAQRWHYGRGYAADRTSGRRFGARFLFGLGALALPLLMTARQARAAAQKGFVPHFIRALSWILALNISWSLGECTGYFAGKSGVAKNF